MAHLAALTDNERPCCILGDESIYIIIVIFNAEYEFNHYHKGNVRAKKFRMRVGREQMAENRSRVFDAASRLVRAKGFDSVSVVEVIEAAGFAHGGFYGHFSSKDDLIAQAVAYALARDAGGAEGNYLDVYFSPRHRDNTADECPTDGLAA
ncbi:MAG TPA: TetR/AcrR family transcriptional regulator, partial [Burkholderiales bacterium]